MDTLTKIRDRINALLMIIGGCFLMAMVLLTCGNIVLRMAWVPIRGTFELMGFAGALVAAFALGQTQIRKGHIAVDILQKAMPPALQRLVSAIGYAAGCLFFAGAAWQVALKALVLQQTGEVTETLQVIYYPFTYAVALGCGALSLVLLIDLVLVFGKKEAHLS